MCVDSILSFPSVLLSSLLYLRCVWCDTKSSNHLHTTPPLLFFLHLSPTVTLLSSINHLSSHYCVAVCGWVSSLLSSPPPPLLPFLVKERMRLEREEATRLLEEETEVRHSSSAGLQTTVLSVQKCHKNTTALTPQAFTTLLILFLFWLLK